jgi:hypothetical protein
MTRPAKWRAPVAFGCGDRVTCPKIGEGTVPVTPITSSDSCRNPAIPGYFAGKGTAALKKSAVSASAHIRAALRAPDSLKWTRSTVSSFASAS